MPVQCLWLPCVSLVGGPCCHPAPASLGLGPLYIRTVLLLSLNRSPTPSMHTNKSQSRGRDWCTPAALEGRWLAILMHTCSQTHIPARSGHAVQMRALGLPAGSAGQARRTAALLHTLLRWAAKRDAWQQVTALPLNAAEEQVGCGDQPLQSCAVHEWSAAVAGPEVGPALHF